MCQHIDFSNTLDGAKCNDCGLEVSGYEETTKETQDGKNEVLNFPRYCSECGEGMWDGYCINGGCEYYCNEKCLHKKYTKEEWEEMYEDGDGNSYWTEWTEDDIEDEDEDREDVFGLEVEEVLKKNGFNAYKNINEGEAIFWSKEDLMKNDEKKQWFYA